MRMTGGLALGCLLIAILGLESRDIAAQVPVRAFDPLGLGEIQQAEAIARADAQVKQFVDPPAQSRLIFTERSEEVEKLPENPVEVPRLADVTFYVYRRSGAPDDSLIKAVVNLTARQVVTVLRLNDVQPPIVPQEIETALGIALRDDRVLRLLARQEITPEQIVATALLFRPEDKESPCSVNRCFELTLNTVDATLRFVPVVNLTLEQVEDVLHR
jgi:Cu2+-containing amine oxidase